MGYRMGPLSSPNSSSESYDSALFCPPTQLLGRTCDHKEGPFVGHFQTPEEDKRARTNMQNGLVFFFLFSFIIFLSL